MEKPDDPVPRTVTFANIVFLLLSLIALGFIYGVSGAIHSAAFVPVKFELPRHFLSVPLAVVGKVVGEYWFIPAALLIAFYCAWIRKSCLRQLWFNAIYCIVLVAAMGLWSYVYLTQQQMTTEALNASTGRMK